jgi:hypothetical protein
MSSTPVSWNAIDPVQAAHLVEARQQVHHALQFVSAFGISFLPPAPDDSHTNLGWSAESGSLESRGVPAAGGELHLALRVIDLTLLLRSVGRTVAEVPLHDTTIADTMAQLSSQLTALGWNGGQYTLRRHFEIPAHAVAEGAPFDAGDRSALHTISTCLANAHEMLGALARERSGSELRLWPHHADLATLFTVAPGRTTGAGLALGDQYFPEPYFYVNAYPTPDRARLTDELAGGGSWHTHEWVGAVLPLTRLNERGEAQHAQVRAFLESALSATTRLLT